MNEILVERGGTAVSNANDTIIEIKSLGATLAVVATDPDAKVSGIGHCILPKSPQKDSKLPDVVTQLRNLFKEMVDKGANVKNLKIILCGAATFLEAPSNISLGIMLYRQAKKAIEKNGLKIAGEHVGGPLNRAVTIEVGAEQAKVILPDNKEILI